MEIKKTGSLILSITKQRIWMYLLWLTVGLFHLPVAAQGCIASPVVETYLVCTGSMNESLKCEPRSVIKGWNISYCPPSPQSPPPPQATQSPPQAQAPQPVASISASKECLLLEAQIEHNYLQCVTDAKKNMLITRLCVHRVHLIVLEVVSMAPSQVLLRTLLVPTVLV